jgi:hypothetical protein
MLYTFQPQERSILALKEGSPSFLSVGTRSILPLTVVPMAGYGRILLKEPVIWQQSGNWVLLTIYGSAERTIRGSKFMGQLLSNGGPLLF